MIQNLLENNVSLGKRAFHETESIKKQIAEKPQKYRNRNKTFVLENKLISNNEKYFNLTFLSDLLSQVTVQIKLEIKNLNQEFDLNFLHNDMVVKTLKINSQNVFCDFKLFVYNSNEISIMTKNANINQVIDKITLTVVGKVEFDALNEKSPFAIISKNNQQNNFYVVRELQEKSYFKEYASVEAMISDDTQNLGFEFVHKPLSCVVLSVGAENKMYYLHKKSDGKYFVLSTHDGAKTKELFSVDNRQYVLTKVLISGTEYLALLSVGVDNVCIYVYDSNLALVHSKTYVQKLMLNIKKIVAFQHQIFTDKAISFVVVDKKNTIHIFSIKNLNFTTNGLVLGTPISISEGTDAYGVYVDGKYKVYICDYYGVTVAEFVKPQISSGFDFKRRNSSVILNAEFGFETRQNTPVFLFDNILTK